MTTDGGGWIVIQRNKKDSLVDFNKNWIDDLETLQLSFVWTVSNALFNTKRTMGDESGLSKE